MSYEEQVIQKLIEEFHCTGNPPVIKRQRRIFMKVSAESFSEVITYAYKELGFKMLCTITGLDAGDNIGLIYHLASESGVMLNLSVDVPGKEPVIGTVTELYQGALLYEKELEDLLGVSVAGITSFGRYPLPDWWPEDQHPLRKAWNPEMLGSQRRCVSDE